jgi:predicted nucleotidyltransferase component of viral defense system
MALVVAGRVVGAMIARQELLDLGTDFGLAPNVVEKDYALGWLLAGFGEHPATRDAWLFKGGTCLKKCFFETYRFSEDLDFTLLNAEHLDKAFLENLFQEVADWIYEKTGLVMPPEARKVDVYTNARGGKSVEGRIGYRGPLGRAGDAPRIKLDLTDDECVVLAADRRQVHHPFSDRPAAGIEVTTYAFEELFAEKVRALAERLRPRDLYDVVHLHRRRELEPARGQVIATLEEKCEFKGIPVPTLQSIQTSPLVGELQTAWEQMLGHQLPELPPFDGFWNELPEVFAWLFEEKVRAVLPAMVVPSAGSLDTTWRPPAMASSWRAFGASAPLEIIRFAAANRLCVELDYRDQSGRRSTRTIEPYSLRRSSEGNLLLFAVKSDTGESRSYRVDRIAGATATRQSFSPRFIIELTDGGPVVAPPLER